MECLFNTITDKKICILGFAFKKNTGRVAKGFKLLFSIYLQLFLSSLLVLEPALTSAIVSDDEWDIGRVLNKRFPPVLMIEMTVKIDIWNTIKQI